MKRNLGAIDRMLRAVIGFGLIGMAATGNIGTWGWIGVIPLLTAELGYCPLYTLVGLDTRSKKTV